MAPRVFSVICLSRGVDDAPPSLPSTRLTKPKPPGCISKSQSSSASTALESHDEPVDLKRSPPTPPIEYVEDVDENGVGFPELTEVSTAATIRLMHRVLELQDIIGTWSEFKELRTSGAQSDYLTRYYVREILSSWRSVQQRYNDVSRMRANGNGSVKATRFEQKLSVLMTRVADWRNKNMPRRDRRDVQDRRPPSSASSLYSPHRVWQQSPSSPMGWYPGGGRFNGNYGAPFAPVTFNGMVYDTTRSGSPLSLVYPGPERSFSRGSSSTNRSPNSYTPSGLSSGSGSGSPLRNSIDQSDNNSSGSNGNNNVKSKSKDPRSADGTENAENGGRCGKTRAEGLADTIVINLADLKLSRKHIESEVELMRKELMLAQFHWVQKQVKKLSISEESGPR